MMGMMKRWSVGFLLLAALAVGWTQLPGSPASKRVIGQTARVEIAESGLEFLGRVDTGAASTSVHAESVRVDGETVNFILVNRSGGRVEMRAPLMKKDVIRNSLGREQRVYVELTVRHDGVTKRVCANLNDRSGLTYPLLLGRDWLQDDFIVDVARDPQPTPQPWVSGQPAPEGSRGIASR